MRLSNARIGRGVRISWQRRAVGFLVAAVMSAVIAVVLDGICFLVLGETSAGTWYDKYWMGFFFCCAFIASSFYLLRDKLADEPEYLYLIIVLVVGVFMAWSLSVYIMGWDTGIHLNIVLDYADLDDEFEISLSEFAFTRSSYDLVMDDVQMSLDGLYRLKGTLNELDNGVYYADGGFANARILDSINYIPCAVVMYFCELLNLSFETKLFLSVLPCILIYGIVTFFGMRKLRRRKMLYAIIALFPTAVFIAANYGYQYWTTSFFLYGFATLMSFFQRKEVVSPFEIAKMLIAFVLACLAKVAYAPLILLALLVPKACFSSKRACYGYRGAIVFVTVLVASVFVVPILVFGLGGGDVRGGDEINPSAQLAFILANPLYYLSHLGAFLAPPFVDSPNGIVSGYLSLAGTHKFIATLGYLNPLPRFISLLVCIVLLFVTLTDKDRGEKYGIVPAVACIVMCFANIVLIATYMLLDFNNVGEIAFRGVSGRYLLPFVFPTLMFLGSHNWGLNGSRIPSGVYNAVALAFMACVLMICWWMSYLVNIY